MLADLHLAEDAFALHLLLECLEGLVDVIVTDENLHVLFLFNLRLIGPTAKAPRPLVLLLSLYGIRPLTGSEKRLQLGESRKIAVHVTVLKKA
jgi:hypothetical protein